MGRPGGEMAERNSRQTIVNEVDHTSLREKPIMPTTPMHSETDNAPLTMRLIKCQS